MQSSKDLPPHREGPRGLKYFISYFLLLDDSWRILAGTVLAVLLTPRLLPVDRTGMGRYVLFIMIVVVGWAVTGPPARWITQRLQSLFKSS